MIDASLLDDADYMQNAVDWIAGHLTDYLMDGVIDGDLSAGKRRKKKIEDYKRKYYLAHRDEISRRNKQRYIYNREEILSKAKAYYWRKNEDDNRGCNL